MVVWGFIFFFRNYRIIYFFNGIFFKYKLSIIFLFLSNFNVIIKGEDMIIFIKFILNE